MEDVAITLVVLLLILAVDGVVAAPELAPGEEYANDEYKDVVVVVLSAAVDDVPITLLLLYTDLDADDKDAEDAKELA